MKKQLLLLTSASLLVASTTIVRAQDKKLSFGLNVGVGLPMGDFSKSDSSGLPLSRYAANPGKNGNDTTKFNGFAKMGFHFDVYATYMFTPNVGGMIDLGGTMNSYDITTFNTVAAAEYTNSGGLGAVPAFTSSGSYFIGQYFIGPYFAFPLGNDKLKLELKGLVGLLTANYPTLSYNYSFLGTTIADSYSVKSASGFGYRIGAGLKYMVTDMIGLHFDLGYTGSSVSYSNWTETGTSGGTSQSITDPVSKSMSLSLLQITVGGSIDL